MSIDAQVERLIDLSFVRDMFCLWSHRMINFVCCRRKRIVEGNQIPKRRPIWKNPIFILNSVLVVSIIFFFLLKFYRVQVIFDGTFGSKPDELIKIISDCFPNSSNQEIEVVFVFNSLPSRSQIEYLEKLYKKFSNNAGIFALFNTKFRGTLKMSFPYHFSNHLVIKYKKNGENVQDNFFMILKNKRIEYIEGNFNFADVAFLVQKKINPNLEYRDVALSAAKLKTQIINRLKEKNPVLFSIDTGEYEKIAPNFSKGLSKIYFFHAKCSSCQLKSMLSNIKIKKILEPGKIRVIFSVMADRFELSKILNEQKLGPGIYIDQNDEFGLFSVITDDKNNPIIIDAGEIKD